MSTDPKSLAAEIEAVTCSLTCAEQYLIEADFGAAAAAVREASRLLEAQASEIAALQSRGFEDGAQSAEIFARYVHAGQTDKGGAPYTGHLGRVAARARAHAEALDLGEQTAIFCAQVGWLHDVIEDCTGEDMSTLAEAGFHPDVCQNVDWLSRNGTTWGDGEPFYPDWIEWICRHTSLVAIIVKLSDVEDNLDPSRTLGGSDKLRARYQAAAEMLRAALAEQEKGDA